MAAESFSTKWNFSPLRYNFGTAAANTANAVLLGSSTIMMASQGGNARLAFAAAAALAYNTVVMPVIGRQLMGHLLSQYTTPPDKATEALVNKHLKRAAVADQVDIRIAHIPDRDEDGRKIKMNKRLKASMNYGAAVIPAMYSPRGRMTVYFGKGMLEMLNKHELTAVLCHEISHMKNKNYPKANVLINTGITTGFIMGVISIMNVQPVLAATCFSVWAAGKILQGVAGQFDEFRADYNSCGQYPHPTALPDALNKVRAKFTEVMYPDGPQGWLYHYRTISRLLFGEHPSNPRRAAAHESRLEGVKAFYKENNFKLPC